MLRGGRFSVEILEQSSGLVVFRASGLNAITLFSNESGGHRWQRIPPTEKRGRVQTSTITVAVLSEPDEKEFKLNLSDLEWKTTKGSGPGGQHRNKTESAVILTHVPSKTVVRCESERSQHQNKESALKILRAKLLNKQESDKSSASNNSRKDQVGTGMRGDKIRTIREQDGIVTDHRLNVKIRLSNYLKGQWDGLV